MRDERATGKVTVGHRCVNSPPIAPIHYQGNSTIYTHTFHVSDLRLSTIETTGMGGRSYGRLIDDRILLSSVECNPICQFQRRQMGLFLLYSPTCSPTRLLQSHPSSYYVSVICLRMCAIFTLQVVSHVTSCAPNDTPNSARPKLKAFEEWAKNTVIILMPSSFDSIVLSLKNLKRASISALLRPCHHDHHHRDSHTPSTGTRLSAPAKTVRRVVGEQHAQTSSTVRQTTRRFVRPR